MAETHEPGAPHGGGVDSELNFRAIFGFVIGLCGVSLVVFALMWGVMVWQKSRLASHDAPAPVLPEAREKTVPPGPLLQSDPERDLREMRAREHAELTGWAWTDGSKTHARVPVARAAEIVLAKGFPPRTAPPPEPPAATKEIKK
jgi:hypothetical protein